MRKFILIAAMVLASTAVQARDNLITQLPSEEPAASEQKPVEAPKYVARPAAVDKAAEQPKSEAKYEKAEAKKPVAEKSYKASRTERPFRRDDITEARVIQELNRRGINW
jgi:hypothetical protein